jgi:ABC-type Mn2+/Zn2+ transport system ATPase subunit
MTNVVLELKGLSLGYAPAPAPFVVQDVDLELRSGEFLILKGRNGCGKSTLLRGLLGLVPRSKGLLRWHVSQGEVGYVPQDAAIESGTPATALDVVRAADPARWAFNAAVARALLARTGLDAAAGTRFTELSGGQRRRVLFARALLGDPKVLLLDEPTANVDVETESEMEGWVNDLRAERGTAVLAISHGTEWATSARVLHIVRGKLKHD